MTSETVPHLRVVTRALNAVPDLLTYADPHDPLLWLRDGRGCVGIGEAARLTFSGPRRFADAAETWRNIVEAATVDDAVARPGSGLTALGAFAFDDASDAESVLIVPQKLVAFDGEIAWTTAVWHADETPQSVADVPAPDPDFTVDPGAWVGTEFTATEASLTAYLDGVSIAVQRIADRAADKIVLARQVEGSLDAGADLRVPLGRLASRYTDCWTFAVEGLIGASPETLIRSARGEVSARVLAGTRRRRSEDVDRDAAERDELLASAKEQQEHAFAVQSVVTALSPYVRDLEASPDPFALELPNVWHLATDLQAQLTGQSVSLVLAGALHPTAAVAGTPTDAAVASIAELEPFDRGRYSGAVGWIDASGDGEWAIALRCAQLAPPAGGKRAVVASAGGGIVAGSDPEHELGETVSKLRPIAEAFAS